MVVHFFRIKPYNAAEETAGLNSGGTRGDCGLSYHTPDFLYLPSFLRCLRNSQAMNLGVTVDEWISDLKMDTSR